MVHHNHLAIVSEEHIAGYVPGRRYNVGQVVHILSAEKPMNPEDNTTDINSKIPVLWSNGRMGGRAVVRVIQRCGGNSTMNSWHGQHILPKVPWSVEHEDTKILLLQQEGSTGLDLSFATHIFLLERINNPGLRNQIISRAHRVGATGPVQVQLLQVVAEEEEERFKAELAKQQEHQGNGSHANNPVVVSLL